MPKFYECGCCGCWHRDDKNADCRQDDLRWNYEDIVATYGDAWEEVPMVPGGKMLSEL